MMKFLSCLINYGNVCLALRVGSYRVSPSLPRPNKSTDRTALSFHPTCSSYAIEALKSYGFVKVVGYRANVY